MKAKRLVQSKPADRGTLLPMILVVIVMLTLGGYAYTEQMLTEMESTVMYARDVQARAMADSGVELTLEMLAQRAMIGEENLYHAPAVFQQVLLPSDIPRGNARFSVVAPIESDPNATRPRLGLMNESGKINLNALINLDLDEEEMRNILMGGPEELIMTIDLADLILDYLDPDMESRQFGGETDFNKNAPLETLDELLTIDLITREMLYGEDANQNGMLDPGEDINGDGFFQLGWNAFLTVYSLESNLRTDGTEKININQSLLTELYDAIATELDEPAAQFVVAYRMNGPVQPDEGDEGTGRTATGSGEQNSEEFVRDAARAVARAVGGATDGSVTRGGMDLSQGAKNQFKSIYDLVGSQVEVEIEGKPTTLDSPWPEDPNAMLEYLPILMDAFSLTDDPTILGRVNINEARLEVLMGLPGMTEALAQYIINQQMIDAAGQPLTDIINQRATTGWLLMNGQLDLPTLRALDQFITARGDVFRAQIVGHFDAGGPVCRLEAVIDATQQPPKLIQLRDLTDLGRGFSHGQLLQQ